MHGVHGTAKCAGVAKFCMLIYESAAVTAIAYFILSGLAPRLRSRRGKAFFFTAALSVYVPWFFVHTFHVRLGPWVSYAAGTWVFACLPSAVLGLPLLGIARLRRRLKRSQALVTDASSPVDEGRRQAMARLALPAISLSLGAIGSAQGNTEFIVKQVELRLRNWPKALDGFRIGQITDTHIGDFVSVETLIRAVEVLNRSSVHVQVMTGDLIDDLHYLEATFAALQRCEAPHGMLAVLGNHEKMHSRLGPILAAYSARLGRGPIRLLVDQSQVIRHQGASLCVVGVDYPMRENGHHSLRRAERMAIMAASADRAFAGLPTNGEPRLCLSHHPEFFPFAAKHGANATLSGHTHGGQVAFLGESLFPIYDYMLGHYRRGDSHLYVSGGTGHWLPYRLGVPAEVTVLTLRTG